MASSQTRNYCGSRGDRVAYQTAFELGPRPTPRDNYFAQLRALGNGGDARFYRSLHIPVAVIADLDLILDPPGWAASLRPWQATHVPQS